LDALGRQEPGPDDLAGVDLDVGRLVEDALVDVEGVAAELELLGAVVGELERARRDVDVELLAQLDRKSVV